MREKNCNGGRRSLRRKRNKSRNNLGAEEEQMLTRAGEKLNAKRGGPSLPDKGLFEVKKK